MSHSTQSTTRRIVYTAAGLDGEVRRVTASNITWNVDVARSYAAADLRDDLGHIPCDIEDIDILDVREVEAADNDLETRPCDNDQLLAQIGRQNVLAISGGRVTRREDGITLPVRYGYSVEIYLTANDTYTVRRVFTRSGESSVKGERTGVHAHEVGDVAYKASCYKDDF